MSNNQEKELNAKVERGIDMAMDNLSGHLSDVLTGKLTDTLASKLTCKTSDKFTETPWAVIESYFKDQHLAQLVRHQIESYNNFVIIKFRKRLICLIQFKSVQRMILTRKRKVQLGIIHYI